MPALYVGLVRRVSQCSVQTVKRPRGLPPLRSLPSIPLPPLLFPAWMQLEPLEGLQELWKLSEWIRAPKRIWVRL